MTDRLYFTRRGLEKLRNEISVLEERLQDLQSQTGHIAEVGGDQWHDNAGYEALVIDIRGVDRRLSDAHRALNNAVLVEHPTSFDRVVIGVQVKVVQDGEEATWEIGGFGESDPSQGMIAYNTPLASLMLGKRKGDEVRGMIADRDTRILILDIAKGAQ